VLCLYTSKHKLLCPGVQSEPNRMALERFSKHQKWILIALAVCLVLPMGVMGIWQRVMSERDQKVAELFDDDVSAQELGSFIARWRTIAHVNRPLAARLGLLEEEGIDRYFVLTRVARECGIDVLDGEVAERALMLLRLDRSATREQYKRLLSRQYEIPMEPFEQALRELISCEKLMLEVARSIKVTDDEMWRYYDENFSKVKLDVVTLEARDFAEEATAPTEEEIAARYERDKETEWLMPPRRVKVAYAGALYEAWADLVKIEQADIEAYYERKKADFVIEEPEGEAGQSPPASETDAPSGAPVIRSAEEMGEGAAGDGLAGEEEEEEEEKPRYRPLEEVKEEIEAIIRKRRAKEDARTIVVKARREAEIHGIKEAAERNGLLQGTTEWFSADEATDVPVVGGASSDPYADSQTLEAVAFGLEGVIGVCRNERGAFIAKVIEDRPAYVPEPAEVRETIIERLIEEKRIEAAQAAGAGIVAAAQSGDFAEAVASVGKEGLTVESIGDIEVWYPRPYARAAARSQVGTVSLTSDLGAEPPAVYVWKVVERKQPSAEEFQGFKDYYGAVAVLNSKYDNIAAWIQSDVNAFARWRRVDKKSEDKGDETSPPDSRTEP